MRKQISGAKTFFSDRHKSQLNAFTNKHIARQLLRSISSFMVRLNFKFKNERIFSAKFTSRDIFADFHIFSKYHALFAIMKRFYVIKRLLLPAGWLGLRFMFDLTIIAGTLFKQFLEQFASLFTSWAASFFAKGSRCFACFRVFAINRYTSYSSAKRNFPQLNYPIYYTKFKQNKHLRKDCQ